MLFLFYECGMRMRPRDGAKLVIITWRIDVLKMRDGPTRRSDSLTNPYHQVGRIAVVSLKKDYV